MQLLLTYTKPNLTKQTNQKKKKRKKQKTKQKKRIYRFDRKKRISDSDCTAKNTWYKKGPLFDMPLKENNTEVFLRDIICTIHAV